MVEPNIYTHSYRVEALLQLFPWRRQCMACPSNPRDLSMLAVVARQVVHLTRAGYIQNTFAYGNSGKKP